MSSKQLLHIDEFGSDVDELLIRSIYKINQSNTPEVAQSIHVDPYPWERSGQ
jgi:hypothetical protein